MLSTTFLASTYLVLSAADDDDDATFEDAEDDAVAALPSTENAFLLYSQHH